MKSPVPDTETQAITTKLNLKTFKESELLHIKSQGGQRPVFVAA